MIDRIPEQTTNTRPTIFIDEDDDRYIDYMAELMAAAREGCDFEDDEWDDNDYVSDIIADIHDAEMEVKKLLN